MTTVEFEQAVRGAWLADIDSEPMPAMPIVDRLIRPCSCGAAAVAMVYQWAPHGQSTYVAKCRDHKAVTA